MKKFSSVVLFTILSLGILSFNVACKAKKEVTKQQKADMNSAYNELKTALPEAIVTLEDDKVKLVFPEAILFNVNSTEINQSYIPTLGKLATVLNKFPKTSVLISGYTDISGAAEQNEKLSWGRAESAKQALLNYEVKNKRVYTWGFGSKNPIASNQTFEGRQQNRRVEFVVLYNYQDEKSAKK